MSFEVIDTRYLGMDNAIACHRIGDVLIDPGPAQSIEHVIDALGDIVPRVVLLTHVHLDHAGGTGQLVEHYPELQVYVHTDGVKHMVDPTRLVASTSRTFGDADERWGKTIPIPADHVHAIEDGDVLEGFEVIHTPGHSGHHVCFFHQESEMALVGDLAGQSIHPDEFVIVSTPPPEVDVELWIQSIDRVAERFPFTLGLTHFGRITDVIGQFERAKSALRRAAELVRDGTEEEYAKFIEDGLETVTPHFAEALMDALPPIDQNYAGLVRYWSKRAEAQSDAAAE